MRKFLNRLIVTLSSILIASALAYGAANRSVVESNLTSVVLDLNEELSFIFQRLPQNLDTLAGTNNYTASVKDMDLLTAYADGQQFTGIIPNTNTSTTVNLNIDNLGDIPVVDKAGSSIPVGALAANSAYRFQYFSASNHFRVMSPLTVAGAVADEFCVAASDETTTLTTGAAKVTFNMPRAMTVTSVAAYLRTAATGLVTVDINEDADAEGAGASTTILSTKLTIDGNERRSSTAATAPVISDSALAQHSEMTIDIDAIVSGSPNGLKVCLVGAFS